MNLDDLRRRLDGDTALELTLAMFAIGSAACGLIAWLAVPLATA